MSLVQVFNFASAYDTNQFFATLPVTAITYHSHARRGNAASDALRPSEITKPPPNSKSHSHDPLHHSPASPVPDDL